MKDKAVLISIQPKWVGKIASGEKTIEVRKSRPKLETPFKCYIYCTKIKNGSLKTRRGIEELGNPVYRIDGKVIGEFVCNEITPLFNVATTSWDLLAGNVHEYAKALVRKARLTEEEIHSYANGKYCYAWHITDLKIYDKPKELSEFKSWYECGNNSCGTCDKCDKDWHLKKPPQSWCYVEEL